MPRIDQLESVRVGRRVAATHDDRFVAAALLHDVGKADAQLGPIGRALATVAGALAGHDIALAWQKRGGISRRFGLYLRHDVIGADKLRVGGARTEAIEWAAVHHHSDQWPTAHIPVAVARDLARADGERVSESD